MTFDSLDADPSARLLRNPSICTYDIADEAVLVEPEEQGLIALNATARAVWEQCDGTRTVEEISRGFARRYDAAYAEVAEGVRAIVSDLHAKRLLLALPPEGASQGAPRTFYVEFEHHHVEVYVDAPELAHGFERSMEATLGCGAGLSAGRIEARAYGPEYRGRLGQEAEQDLPSCADAVVWLRRHANWLLIRARPDLLWFHACGAARNGRSVLGAGDYGSGKSTLVTSLYRLGWDYLTDDVLPYDPTSGCLLPYPHTPSYRRGGSEDLPAERLDTLPRTRVRLEATRVAQRPVPLALIVFPVFQRRNRQTPAPRSPASTVVKLARHCFNVDTYRGDPVRALSALAERVPAYDLQYNEDAPASHCMLHHQLF